MANNTIFLQIMLENSNNMFLLVLKEAQNLSSFPRKMILTCSLAFPLLIACAQAAVVVSNEIC
jgi:hypothetical protein